MIAAIIVGIIIAGILISSAFTSPSEETGVSPSEETGVSPSEETEDTTPPSVEPTQGRALTLEFNESMVTGDRP